MLTEDDNREAEMRYVMGMMLASGLLLGLTDESKAQFSISIGNPYAGQGYNNYGGGGYGYGNGYSNYSNYNGGGYSNGYTAYSNSAYVAGPGNFGYNSGYNGYAAPVVPTYYNSGYAGYAPANTGYSYGYSPYVQSYNQGYRQFAPTYQSYGYRNNNPFGLIRGLTQMFR